jgi:hypothetical protein
MYQRIHFPNSELSSSSSSLAANKQVQLLGTVRIFLRQSLETLQRQAIELCQVAFDFDYLITTASGSSAAAAAVASCDRSSRSEEEEDGTTTTTTTTATTTKITSTNTTTPSRFQQALTSLGPESRQAAWKLARCLVLEEHFTANGGSGSGSPSTRRQCILGMAATLVLMAALGCFDYYNNNKKKNGDDTTATAAATATTSNSISNNTEDVLNLVLNATDQLCTYLAWTHQEVPKISSKDLEQRVYEMVESICKLPVVVQHQHRQQQQQAPRSSSISSSMEQYDDADDDPSHELEEPGEAFWNRLRRTVPKLQLHFLRQHYRAIVDGFVLQTQARLNPLTVSPIGSVLFLAPTVVGEPWGLPPHDPQQTAKFFCTYVTDRPSDSREGVAVVALPGSKRPPTISMGEGSTPSAAAASNTKSATKVQIYNKNPVKNPIKPAISKIGSTVEDAIRIEEEEEDGSLDRKANSGDDAIPIEDDNAAPDESTATAVQPPVITDAMELNEWTLSVLSLSVVKPSDNLLQELDDHDDHGTTNVLKDIVVPVLNRALTRIQKDSNMDRYVISVGKQDGQVYVNGDVTPDLQFYAAMVGVYYHALESLLADEVAPKKPLSSEPFHRALFACCYTCVLKAVGGYPKLRISSTYQDVTVFSLLETIESSPYTFLKVCESFYRAILQQEDGGISNNKDEDQPAEGRSPIVPGLPRILQRHIKRTEIQIIDSVIWVKSSTNSLLNASEGSLANTIRMIKSRTGAWPPDALEPVLPEEMEDLGATEEEIYIMNKPETPNTPETNFLSYVLRKVLKVVYYRIQGLCCALNINPSPDFPVATQILVGFRFLLRNRIELMFDRHVDQLILCCAYGVCRRLKAQPEITFVRIIDAYLAVRGQEIGEKACQLIIRHIKLASSDDEVLSPGQSSLGDIIQFYNKSFVPNMKKHFLNSASLNRANKQLAMRKAMNFPQMMPSTVLPVAQAKEGNTEVHVTVGQGNGTSDKSSNASGDISFQSGTEKRRFSEMGDSSKFAKKVKA